MSEKPAGSNGMGACPDCGAVDVGGRDGCQELFEDVIAREFSRPELFHIHRLTVDAYSLQHPARYMKSAKSGAAHLAGMCWSLEYGGGPEVSRLIGRWLDGAVDLAGLEPPVSAERGGLTVREVYLTTESADHIRAVREWAASTWAAWEGHHGQARTWVEGAMARFGA